MCDLPVCQYETDLYRGRSKPSINLLISDRAEKMLSDNGFIPLSAVSGTEHLVFYSNASTQKPIEYDSLSATVNAKLSCMLQYILCVSRFAHYIKAIGREKKLVHTEMRISVNVSYKSGFFNIRQHQNLLRMLFEVNIH